MWRCEDVGIEGLQIRQFDYSTIRQCSILERALELVTWAPGTRNLPACRLTHQIQKNLRAGGFGFWILDCGFWISELPD